MLKTALALLALLVSTSSFAQIGDIGYTKAKIINNLKNQGYEYLSGTAGEIISEMEGGILNYYYFKGNTCNVIKTINPIVDTKENRQFIISNFCDGVKKVVANGVTTCYASDGFKYTIFFKYSDIVGSTCAYVKKEKFTRK